MEKDDLDFSSFKMRMQPGWRFSIGLGLLAALSLGGYLLASQAMLRIGFPLDDAWIHQTYARNLALLGEWSYVPGQPSAGSTSPLWTALLAVWHALRLGPYLGTYLLGWGLLLALGLTGMRALGALSPGKDAWLPWAGALLVFEWHLVWAAASGMETLLFALLVLLVLSWLAAGRLRWGQLGLLIGLSVWIRPDGITLIGPALLMVYLSEPTWKWRLRAVGRLFSGVGMLFLPYVIFNRLVAGAWWPNTFYAKQAEYAILVQTPFIQRLADQVKPSLQGVGAALLPGFFLMVWKGFKRRSWGGLAGAAWLIGYLILYAWRLPVAYQHGRYLMPAMPIFFLWSFAGLVGWVRLRSVELFPKVIGKAWIASILLILILYWGMGARAYGGDVAFIETEMVAAANWVSENTEADALIAAHDIGALGYFGQRRLLDLAGLVSPNVIPFIRDENRLADELDREGADYLVTFPEWYPQLTQMADFLYRTGGVFSIPLGGENIAVFRWRAAP